jgi:glycosyltransferase involved in cell wall biosynthesis
MLPRITVVTPSYNQGQFIGRTIDSVLAQDYPNLEHIVVDGMSRDDTPQVLQRYPHLRVIREPDRGQADAINKGFRHATGDVLCFLNSDDVFYPGALQRVASELDPASGRHVVMGRCLFIDEEDRSTGVEHPSVFRGHEGVLAVWNGHCIPQPATFWTREVWERCGPLDAAEQLVLDYDLMCRFSSRYEFHFIDQLLAGYRLHSQSKTCSNPGDQIYAEATRISRRYWGRPWRLRYWRLLASLGLTRLEQRYGRNESAVDWSLMSRAAWARRRPVRALAYWGFGALLAPEVALRRAYYEWAVPVLRGTWPALRGPGRTWDDADLPGTTSAYRSFTGAHPDGHVGPHYEAEFHHEPGRAVFPLNGLTVLPGPLAVRAAIDGRPVLERLLPGGRPFCLALPTAALRPGMHRLTITADAFLVPSLYLGTLDYRPLAFRLLAPVGGERQPAATPARLAA